MPLYNVYSANHGKHSLQVGHDEVIRWYLTIDGENWSSVHGYTLKTALEEAHRMYHHGAECPEKLDWQLDQLTRATVLGQCPECTNPALNSDLETYRSCPDCGWRVDFTDEQIKWINDKLAERR